MRFIVLFILALPAVLHLLLLVPGALESLGLNVREIFYSDGNIDAQKMLIGVLGSLLSLLIGAELVRTAGNVDP